MTQMTCRDRLQKCVALAIAVAACGLLCACNHEQDVFMIAPMETDAVEVAGITQNKGGILYHAPYRQINPQEYRSCAFIEPVTGKPDPRTLYQIALAHPGPRAASSPAEATKIAVIAGRTAAYAGRATDAAAQAAIAKAKSAESLAKVNEAVNAIAAGPDRTAADKMAALAKTASTSADAAATATVNASSKSAAAATSASDASAMVSHAQLNITDAERAEASRRLALTEKAQADASVKADEKTLQDATDAAKKDTTDTALSTAASKAADALKKSKDVQTLKKAAATQAEAIARSKADLAADSQVKARAAESAWSSAAIEAAKATKGSADATKSAMDSIAAAHQALAASTNDAIKKANESMAAAKLAIDAAAEAAAMSNDLAQQSRDMPSASDAAITWTGTRPLTEEEEMSRLARNELVLKMLEVSDYNCSQHLSRVTGFQIEVDLISGMATLGLAGAATVATGGTAQALAAAATATTGFGTLFNDTVYRNALVQTLVGTIRSRREEFYKGEIEPNLEKSVADYEPGKAISQIRQYHEMGSFYVGLTFIREAAERSNQSRTGVIDETMQANLSTALAEAQLKRNTAQKKADDAKPAAPATPAAAPKADTSSK